MSLEQLLKQAFSEEKILSQRLAKYQGVPAVFYRIAPAKQDSGWDTSQQYPRLCFDLQMQENPARKTAGRLEVSLQGELTGTPPEELEPYVKALLNHRFFVPDEHNPYCFLWCSTGRSQKPNLLVHNIIFDLLEFPSLQTNDYDPVVALRKWLKEMLPETWIAGVDVFPKEFSSEGTPPVLYCRLDSVERGEETNQLVWMNGQIAIHILSPSALLRLKLAASISTGISLAGELLADGEPPMTISQLQVKPGADYQKEGALLVGIRYGLPRPEAAGELIQKIGIDLR